MSSDEEAIDYATTPLAYRWSFRVQLTDLEEREWTVTATDVADPRKKVTFPIWADDEGEAIYIANRCVRRGVPDQLEPATP
jgi:hypothetical protein